MYTLWSIDSQENEKNCTTRCQILRLKCTKFDFSWGSAPDPAGGVYGAPPDLRANNNDNNNNNNTGRKRLTAELNSLTTYTIKIYIKSLGQAKS